ncbi:hypothetical protein PGPR2_16050 [Pseudomonas aeruginosa PGPR2]|nr:hypothetical protein PGPR2_16050 [Pseudomonas aeruginosa PGPR2]
MHAADRSLSYAELERESAALAVRLRAAGVAPEQRVGVCLRRDSGLLVGLLGVLRAGGCYVPLDPAYPEERVATCSTTPTACWCWSTRAPASGSPRWAGHA